MYLLPDCSTQARDSILSLARQHSIPVHVMQLTVGTLDGVAS